MCNPRFRTLLPAVPWLPVLQTIASVMPERSGPPNLALKRNAKSHVSLQWLPRPHVPCRLAPGRDQKCEKWSRPQNDPFINKFNKKSYHFWPGVGGTPGRDQKCEKWSRSQNDPFIHKFNKKSYTCIAPCSVSLSLSRSLVCLYRDVFMVVRDSRMWCPHDIGRDSWVWGEQETL